MGSINKSHNEADGGILLFSGELILLYCDSVQCEIGGKESVKGRVYLTTHRMVMIVTPYRQSSAVKSLCAPFCAISKCSVEQPIFGANYIDATVRDETDPNKSFSFKLKFSKGGAIEFAMAMNRAVAAIGRNYNPTMQPPPAYTPSPSDQYYQAPPTVYAPGYNSGVQMPVQQFPDRPPIGFIYTSSAPPPYPGLGGNTPAPQTQPPPYYQPAAGTPGGAYPQQQGGYPGQQQQQQPMGYPQQQPQSGYPAGYPQQPAQSGYPGQQPAPGYPGQQAPSGYPSQPSGQTYPGQQQPSSQQPPAAGVYPDLSQTGNTGGYPAQQPPAQAPNGPPQAPQSSGNDQAAWPSAPSFNPNWKQ